MPCEWSVDNCRFLNTNKCDTCFTYRQNYREKNPARKIKLAKHQAKENRRAGGSFELKNHLSNVEILKDNVVSGMTLNSGATVLEKGDEQIRGIIKIMEELKTKTSQRTKGEKTFTIHKEWLDKLHREALKENQEFWYLKFNFFESDKDVYVITEQDIIMAMVKTMVEDRRKVKLAEEQISTAKSFASWLQKENELLKAELEYYRNLNKVRKGEN